MSIKHVVKSALVLSIAAQTVTGARASHVAAGLRQAPQDDVVRITTNLVQVDVIVTDKDGRRVADLRPEDFEIVEGGKRQQITHFSYLDFGGAAVKLNDAKNDGQFSPGAAAAPPAPPRLDRSQVRRTFALVVDDLGLSFESFGFVKKAVRSFVEERMLPGDLVAVIRTSSGAGAAQQFTSDKRQLLAIVDRLGWSPKGRGGLSPVRTLNEASAGSDFTDTVQFTEEAEEMRAGLYSVGTFGAVGALVQGMADLPGRKSLVFFSEAFRLFQAQGRNVQLIKAMQQLTDRANAASVSIYAVDASGLQTDQLEASDNPAARAYVMDPQFLAQAIASGGASNSVQNVNAPPRTLPRADSLSAQAEQDSGNAFRRLQALSDQRAAGRQESHTVLSFLAANTGGLFLNNRNDLGGALERVAEDNSGYYLLGFRPDDASMDAAGRPRLRRLAIKVKRSGLKVRTRSGYAAGAEGARRAKPRTRDEQLAAALVSPFAAAEVGVRVTSLFGVEPNGAPYLRSLVHVDARALSFREAEGGKRQAELDIVAVAFGRDGGAVEQLSYPQTITAENEDAYRRLVEQGLSYILNMPLKQGGPYQVRVAVRDNGSGKVGAAAQYVEVPELGKKMLALSGIVLSGIPSGAGTPAGAAGDDPRLGPAVRILPRGTMLDYRYQIYNAQTDAAGRPQVQTQMRLFRDGQQVFGGRVLPLDAAGQKDLKRLAAAGRLRLGPELTPGSYLLQVTVTDTLAPDKHRVATQWIDFEIVD